MKNMTMMQVVAELMAGGHQVQFYVRKDGGILIQRIDDKRFKGAKGNARAREMTGQNLSEARMAQLKYATKARQELRSPKLKNVKIPDAVQKAYEKSKKKWDKAFKAKEGKPHPAGYLGKTRLKKTLADYDETEALRRMSEAERYASGLAYTKNVQGLAVEIRKAGNDYESNELLTLANDVEENAYMIREEWIYPAYQALYKLTKGQTPAEVVSNVRSILRLPK